MKTFFYSVHEERCRDRCSYQTCPRRYLARLQNIIRQSDICRLEGEILHLYGPSETSPHHGDIIILYAEDGHDLEQFISARDRFEGLRRILVLGEEGGIDVSRYHKLAPRYITCAERSPTELGSVIEKMTQQFN